MAAPMDCDDEAAPSEALAAAARGGGTAEGAPTAAHRGALLAPPLTRSAAAAMLQVLPAILALLNLRERARSSLVRLPKRAGPCHLTALRGVAPHAARAACRCAARGAPLRASARCGASWTCARTR
jgi:hypothetical protein